MITATPEAEPGTEAPTRQHAIGRHLAGTYARDRVVAALYEVVVDSVAFGPCRLRPSAGRDWMRSAIAEPLGIATDAALAALAAELDRVFATAPDEVRAWLAAPAD